MVLCLSGVLFTMLCIAERMLRKFFFILSLLNKKLPKLRIALEVFYTDLLHTLAIITCVGHHAL